MTLHNTVSPSASYGKKRHLTTSESAAQKKYMKNSDLKPSWKSNTRTTKSEMGG